MPSMAKTNALLFFSLFLVLFHGSSGLTADRSRNHQGQCQLDRLDALKPDNRVRSEAGLTESWDPNHDQFQCAGVAVVRRTIEPNGLLLPSYSNAPQLVYIVQGRGVAGTLMPGCPETFQESQGQGSRGLQDQHQKVHRFREGDVIALPAGVAQWCYNDGNERVITVAVLDVANNANQLDDMSPRNFYLAGNPQEDFQQEQGQSRQRREQRAGRQPFRGHDQQQQCSNIFCGMETSLLAEAFNVDEQVARRLQNESDRRGNIVRVKGGLQIVMPPSLRQDEHEQEHRGEHRNGLEETMCTMRIRENIGDASRADVFTPEAGRISTLNSHKLPILRHIQLSAERGVLYNEAMMVPHWNLNAHSIIYGIRGQAHVQVVDHSGRTVFDGEMREGQVLTVPQNFAVVKRSDQQNFEWVSFKTNDNAMISPLAGRTSALRAMPAEVLANAFRISVEDARRIKFERQETTLISRRSTRSGNWAEA
ncbi:12S SEED STORAGE PROTEIN CRC [Salix viminalis]|uniref:12S SEED STORAGE PROTEIN CRC n=1 Tax=Salix viminalis TaxID=40686 RepID=A0A9Q0ZJ05_SALVM|nr:12S SEED STORAGE PROTEIN CRC [Salix viminalis]